MPRALILTGAGRYADPWHPFAETSAQLAQLVADAGFDVEVRDDVDAALATLADDVTLLVVNAGDPDGPDADGREPDAGSPAPRVDERALQAAIERGLGILAVHAAASSLRDYPRYDLALGGRWVHGTSWHPELGEAHVHLVGDHPVRAGLHDFDLVDERYSGLRLHDVVEPIAEHEEGGVRHPVVWAREFGRSRLVFDALGHDRRSYESAEHRRLLTQAIGWLAAVPAPTLDDLEDGSEEGVAATSGAAASGAEPSHDAESSDDRAE